MKIKQINSILFTLSKKYKSPKTELKFINPFTFLVAVVLSAQSTDIAVNKATKKLYQIVKTPQDMVNLGQQKLKKYIKTIGLSNTKARNIISLSKILINEYNSNIPQDIKSLTSLPGVGQKTASVYQNVILKLPKIAVDTHVFRVSNRMGIVKEKTANKVQEKLEKIIPYKWKYKAHHLFILHGRQICKARNPLCRMCSVSPICKYPFKLK